MSTTTTTATRRSQTQQSHHLQSTSTTLKNKTQKKAKTTMMTSIAAQNKQTTTLMTTSTTTRNRELDEQNEFDEFKNRLKKFKAVREIKLISCLDKKICNISSGNYLISDFNLRIFTLITIFLVF